MDWLTLALKALIVAACGVVALWNAPIRGFLRYIDRKAGHPEDEVAETRKRLGLVAAQRELPGGRWIGLLERAAVYASVVSSFASVGIPVVLAVKGLGRYAELVTTSESGTARKGELFIIGTFASLLWASAWAGVAYWSVRAW